LAAPSRNAPLGEPPQTDGAVVQFVARYVLPCQTPIARGEWMAAAMLVLNFATLLMVFSLL